MAGKVIDMEAAWAAHTAADESCDGDRGEKSSAGKGDKGDKGDMQPRLAG